MIHLQNSSVALPWTHSLLHTFFLSWGKPKTRLSMWSNEWCIEGDKPFSQLTGCVPINASQKAGDPLCWLYSACCPPASPWPLPQNCFSSCHCGRLFLSRCRTLFFFLVEFYESFQPIPLACLGAQLIVLNMNMSTDPIHVISYAYLVCAHICV